MTYNLEFKLLLISEHLHLPINSKALDIYSSKEAPVKALTYHDTTTHSKIYQALLKLKKSKVSWVKDDIKLVQMWNEDYSWEYIFTSLPNRSKGPSGYAIRQNLKSDLV